MSLESPVRDAGGGAPQLIETMLWVRGVGFPRLPGHLERLKRSAQTLRYPFDRKRIVSVLEEGEAGERARVRLTLSASGAIDVTRTEIAAPAEGLVWRLGLAPERLDPDNPWLRHKSTHRDLYDRWRKALPEDVDEMLFLNTRGELCEGTITNVFVDFGQGLVTPPLHCGVLPGVMRAELLEKGDAREGVVPADALKAARRILVSNAVRGLVPARLV